MVVKVWSYLKSLKNGRKINNSFWIQVLIALALCFAMGTWPKSIEIAWMAIDGILQNSSTGCNSPLSSELCIFLLFLLGQVAGYCCTTSHWLLDEHQAPVEHNRITVWVDGLSASIRYRFDAWKLCSFSFERIDPSDVADVWVAAFPTWISRWGKEMPLKLYLPHTSTRHCSLERCDLSRHKPPPYSAGLLLTNGARHPKWNKNNFRQWVELLGNENTEKLLPSRMFATSCFEMLGATFLTALTKSNWKIKNNK